MNKHEIWIMKKLNTARLFLIAGLLVILGGFALEVSKRVLGFDPRLATGMGILLLGVGVSNWLRYFSSKKDPQSAKRAFSAESDERMTAIKAQAGNRGFWTSIALAYALLMWESISSNGSLPALSEDARWYWLAAAVVLPMGIYIANIMISDTRN